MNCLYLPGICHQKTSPPPVLISIPLSCTCMNVAMAGTTLQTTNRWNLMQLNSPCQGWSHHFNPDLVPWSKKEQFNFFPRVHSLVAIATECTQLATEQTWQRTVMSNGPGASLVHVATIAIRQWLTMTTMTFAWQLIVLFSMQTESFRRRLIKYSIT